MAIGGPVFRVKELLFYLKLSVYIHHGHVEYLIVDWTLKRIGNF